jgi:hypothetical protein
MTTVTRQMLADTLNIDVVEVTQVGAKLFYTRGNSHYKPKLYSYFTCVGVYSEHVWYVLKRGQSQTTSAHLNKFCTITQNVVRCDVLPCS